MVAKKTSPNTKSASPAGPQEKKRKAGRAPGKSDTAAPVPGSRIVTRRKRPAGAAAPAPGAVQPKAVVSDEDVRIRAYFLSLEYRGNNRNDVDFWLLAERELRPAKKSAD